MDIAASGELPQPGIKISKSALVDRRGFKIGRKGRSFDTSQTNQCFGTIPFVPVRGFHSQASRKMVSGNLIRDLASFTRRRIVELWHTLRRVCIVPHRRTLYSMLDDYFIKCIVIIFFVS